MTLEYINPPDLPTPKTYTQVVVARGTKLIFVSGQGEPGVIPQDRQGEIQHVRPFRAALRLFHDFFGVLHDPPANEPVSRGGALDPEERTRRETAPVHGNSESVQTRADRSLDRRPVVARSGRVHAVEAIDQGLSFGVDVRQSALLVIVRRAVP